MVRSNNKILVIYQTHKKELYARDIALELAKLKIKNVVVEKSKIKKEYDGRYSRENRIKLAENYMKKRNAKFIIDLHDAYNPNSWRLKKPILINNKVIWDGMKNWKSSKEFAHITCYYPMLEAIKNYFKPYSKLIEIRGGNKTPHPNYYIVDFLPHKEKSESLEFLKYFINYFQSKL